MREKTRDRTTLDYVKPGAEERARLREDFDYNDLNHDGRLTLGEFIRFMRNVDEDMTAEECRDRLRPDRYEPRRRYRF